MATKKNTPTGPVGLNPLSRLAHSLGDGLTRVLHALAARDPSHLPLLKWLPETQRYPTLVLVLLLSVACTVVGLAYHFYRIGNYTAYLETATRLQMLSQRYANLAQLAVLGEEAAFSRLAQGAEEFAAGLEFLSAGRGLRPGAPRAVEPDLAELKRQWAASRANIDILIEQQKPLIGLGAATRLIQQQSGQLFELTEALSGMLQGDGRLARMAAQQSLWTQRMAKNANALATADTIDAEVAYQLDKDTQAFRAAIDGMLQGGGAFNLPAVTDAAARAKLEELAVVFTTYEAGINALMRSLPQLVRGKQAARAILDESDRILELTQRISDRYRQTSHLPSLLFVITAAFMSAAALFMLVLYNLAETRKIGEEAARENRRNQDAILRLLNEMGDLAEGNLTVRATVSEDITGAIADSVNFAIEELRMLVENVNRAADQVTQATVDAKQISDELLAVAERQAQEIARATESVNRMSASISQVAQNAADSAEVASQSLVAAQRGGESVRAGIASMNTLREQIQDTAKRIKRLGESSQEIGEIVELITDITEQTNVLALNAAIQAAAAGEAGRGFSVVAEEVQRLAERSGAATRRIGAIVKTIQSDTQDVVHAMEVSTQGVVESAAKADGAASALQDIEAVSERLARLIQNISESTREQASMATQIAQNMQQVLAQTRLASESARKSAASIGELTVLSDELKVSVAGFKL